MVILKTKQSKTVPVLLGCGTGKFLKKPIKIGGVREIELIGNFFYRSIELKLPFYLGYKPIVDHLLRGKPAVLPADLAL